MFQTLFFSFQSTQSTFHHPLVIKHFKKIPMKFFMTLEYILSQ